MARPRSITKVTCPNSECDFFLLENGKDILKRGKNRAGHQQYKCNHCNKWFVETSNTPLYHKHLSKTEIIRICRLLVETVGIRAIERITGHHRDTIGKLLSDLAEHAEVFNEMLLKDIGLDQQEVDEIWTFIKKNKRNLSQNAKAQLKKVMPGSSHV